MLKAAVKDELKVPAHIDYLGELRNFVTKTGKKNGFSDSIVNAFKLAIDEAATNIIKHAYRDSEGDVTLRIIIKQNCMTIILIDQGRFFDPSKVKDPDLKRYVDIGKKGGLGIFMMRKLIDEIDYRHTEEGNELRLVKYRDGSFRRKEDSAPTQVSSSFLSLSLKSRYSLIAAAILTVVIIIGYIYNYATENRQILNDILEIERSYSEGISNSVSEKKMLTSFNIPVTIKKAVDLDERTEIFRVIILDSANICLFSSDYDTMLVLNEFNLPQKKDNIFKDIYKYKIPENNIEVYDIVSSITSTNDNQKIGKTHLQVRSDYVKSRLTSHQLENLKLAAIILLMGYAGIVILIYLIFNPFNKLADWIKDLGHGEVEDEIDFDTGNEVGEIAKAFSEITDKFRQSQVNLAEQERLQKEMQLAQDIQQTLLPPFVPEIEGYEIASLYGAAKEVGGDYYDFVEVDKDSLGIVVADVSGKGVPGSLIMTMIRTALRTEARGVKSASEVLARLNQFVVKDMKKGMFVTIFYVIIDSKRRRLNYASAGHNPMILYRTTTNKTYYLNPKGFPVGISLPDPELFKKSIESDTIQLAEDDVLLIYTDGITEAMNHSRQLFGEERLLDSIRKFSNLRVQPFADKLMEEIDSFTQGYEQSDDITMVAIKEKSSPEKIQLNRAQEAHRLILEGKSIREACEVAGVTTYAYYNKYKKIFEEEGVEAYSIDESIAVEAKHLSIEEKTRIYDIIKKHPEFGAKRISEELNSELYEYTEINETRVYDELVRSRLNTRQLREAYVARAGKKKRMKPPGTPMLTLDGRIIIDKEAYQQDEEPEEIVEEKEQPLKPAEVSTILTGDDAKTETDQPKELDDDFYIESLMSIPIEDLLNKRPGEKNVEGIEDQQEVEVDEKDTSDDMNDDLFDISSEIDFADSSTTELQETEIENMDEELSIDHDISFRDVWEEQAEEVEKLEEEFSKEFEGETVKADETEDITEQTLIYDNEEQKLDIFDSYFEDPGVEDSEKANIDDEIGFDKLFETGDDEEKSVFEDSVDLDDVDEDTMEHVEVENDEIDEQLEFNMELERMSTDSDDDEFQHNDTISFDDLLSEIEQDVSYLDSGMEFSDSDIDIEQDVTVDELLESDDNNNQQNQRKGLDDILKNSHLILGLKYYKEKNYDEAIEEFQQIVEIFPDFKELYSMLGNAYFRNNMIKKAMSAYKRVTELDPQDVDAYENIGVIYANEGKYLKAITEWEKILEIDPHRLDIQKNVEKAKNILEKDNIRV